MRNLLNSIADNSESTPVETKLPIPMLDRVRDNPTLSGAYHQMIIKVVDAVAADSKESPSRQGETTPLGLTPEQLATLKQDLGYDHVWVVRAGGAQVSTAKTIGVGTLTTVLSLALSGGTYVYMSAPVDGKGYDIALLNLDANAIVWKKRLQGQAGDPTAIGTYNATWAKSLFDPFLVPSAGTLETTTRQAVTATTATEPVPTRAEDTTQSAVVPASTEPSATQASSAQPSAVSASEQPLSPMPIE